MLIEGTSLAVLLVILLMGVILPIFLKKIHLPFVLLLILSGAVLGPNILGYVETNDTILFFGFLGMAFLMLMAGVETDVSKLKELRSKIFILSFFNGFIPFLTGFLIMYFSGYSLTESLLVGIVFISSSVAMIVPVLKSSKFFNKNFGQMVLSSVLITDVVSLVLLAVFFQNISPVTSFPMWIYLPLLIFSLIALFFLIPRIYRFTIKRTEKKENNEEKLRLILIIIIGSIVYFSGLGMHPILASFLVGLMLSGILFDSPDIKEKLNVLGYGLFIPVFFFIIGMDMDLKLITEINFANLIMPLLIFGLIISKFLSGLISGKIVGFSLKESSIFGSISITQLTTTLAVIYVASSLEIITPIITTSIILISIITTFLGPMLVSIITRKDDE